MVKTSNTFLMEKKEKDDICVKCGKKSYDICLNCMRCWTCLDIKCKHYEATKDTVNGEGSCENNGT